MMILWEIHSAIKWVIKINDMTFWWQAELILRIILAGVCGAVIGYERKSRLKEAGIRTHFIVASASALMMIISKYGFFDLLQNATYASEVKLDPSRVASTIITGVGFLGAGAIFIRNNTINGLTTAAGIWATAGVGMAMGTGFYIIGVFSAFVILSVQVFLHKKNWFTDRVPISENIKLIVENTPGTLTEINELLVKRKIEILKIYSKYLN